MAAFAYAEWPEAAMFFIHTELRCRTISCSNVGVEIVSLEYVSFGIR